MRLKAAVVLSLSLVSQGCRDSALSPEGHTPDKRSDVIAVTKVCFGCVLEPTALELNSNLPTEKVIEFQGRTGSRHTLAIAFLNRQFTVHAILNGKTVLYHSDSHGSPTTISTTVEIGQSNRLVLRMVGKVGDRAEVRVFEDPVEDASAIIPTKQVKFASGADLPSDGSLFLFSVHGQPQPITENGASALVSGRGNQVLWVIDEQGQTRALTLSSPATPDEHVALEISARSSALAMLFLVPGLGVGKPQDFATRVERLQALQCFPSLEAAFQSLLLAGRSFDAFGNSNIAGDLIASCINEFMTGQSVASGINAAVIHQTQSNFEVRRSGSNQTASVAFTNNAHRFVDVYRRDPYTSMVEKVTDVGGKLPASWGSLFTTTVGTPGEADDPDFSSFASPAAQYWIIGPGFSASDPVPFEEVGAWRPWFLSIGTYVVMPIVDVIFGLGEIMAPKDVVEFIDAIVPLLDLMALNAATSTADLAAAIVPVAVDLVVLFSDALLSKNLIKELSAVGIKKFLIIGSAVMAGYNIGRFAADLFLSPHAIRFDVLRKVPTDIVVTSGADATYPPHSMATLRVRAVDDTQRGIPNVGLVFHPVDGLDISATSAVTNMDGEAEVTLALGESGQYSLLVRSNVCVPQSVTDADCIVARTFTVAVGGPLRTLAAHYPLDGNSNDVSGNGLHAIREEGTFVADRFGNPNSALDLDGNNDRLILPGASTNSAPEGTVSLWVQFDQPTSAEACRRADLGTGSPFYCHYNMFAKAGPNTGFRAQIGTTVPYNQPANTFYFTVNGEEAANSYVPPNSYSFGSWHMYTFTWNATAKRIYLDGNLLHSVAGAYTSPAIGDLYIGSPVPGPFDFREWLNGRVDDIRIYRRALVASEIAALYVPAPTEARSLVAHYQLDGNGIDQSASANHGIGFGVQATADRHGQPGGATLFNGGQYISVASNPALRNLTNEMTVMMWMRRGGASVPAEIPVSRRERDDRVHFQLYFESTRGMSFHCCSPGGSAAGMYYNPIVSNYSLLNDGQWHHVAAVRKFGPNGYTRLYVDGAFVQGSPLNNGITDQAAVAPVIDAVMTIGRQESASPGYFHGALDDLRIYNYALTDNEIAELGQNANTSYAEELNYGNNLGYFVLHVGSVSAQPDLVVEGITSTQHHLDSPSGTWAVNFRVVNVGPGGTVAQGSTLAAYLSADGVFSPDDRLLAEVAVPQLASGAVHPGSINVEIPAGYAYGQYLRIVLVADARNVVAELNESANDNSYWLHIGTPSRAIGDLTVEGVMSPTQHTVLAGQSWDMQFRVHNMGQGPMTVPTTARVYLSRDRVVSADDVLLGTAVVNPLAHGAFQDIVHRASVPSGYQNGYAYILVETNRP